MGDGTPGNTQDTLLVPFYSHLMVFYFGACLAAIELQLAFLLGGVWFFGGFAYQVASALDARGGRHD